MEQALELQQKDKAPSLQKSTFQCRRQKIKNKQVDRGQIRLWRKLWRTILTREMKFEQRSAGLRGDTRGEEHPTHRCLAHGRKEASGAGAQPREDNGSRKADIQPACTYIQES